MCEPHVLTGKKHGALVMYHVSDAQWARVRPLIARIAHPGGLLEHDLRAMLGAILYRALTGCDWEEIPNSYPPAARIEELYRHWRQLGLLELLSAMLLVRLHVETDELPRPACD